MVTLSGRQQVIDHVGQELGVSDWQLVTQPDIDRFAELTRDRQFIHVDVERAAAGPFGGTIAHGFYTLSLLPAMMAEIIRLEGFAYGVNYGLEKVRFPAPMPVGSRVRMHATLSRAEEVAGGLRIQTSAVFECEDGEKPVCVAEAVSMLYDGG
jgi:acyl dehydratase